VIGFHFLDADTVLFLPLFWLRQWAFGVGDHTARVFNFPERMQRQYSQANDTWVGSSRLTCWPERLACKRSRHIKAIFGKPGARRGRANATLPASVDKLYTNPPSDRSRVSEVWICVHTYRTAREFLTIL
jgi:hypothetical protein